ncbi:MAG: hypothetical protein KBT06_08770, partial [Prevotellaceae bacterium]|nr:hypothetical protein [Candidatus Colivivens equi]
MPSNKIINGTIVLCVFYLVAKSLSFFVESLIATTFGASIETDAYYLADSVILALSPMLSVGIWKVFMPEYKRLSVKGLINETEILTGNLLVVFGAISLIASLLLFIFSNTVINIFAPGFDEIKTNYASYILKILSPILLLGTAATFPSAILQAQSNFSKSQFKEIVVFFVPFLYLVFALNRGISNINGLAISLLIGYILAMLLQFYFLRSSAKLRVGRKIFSKDVVSLLKLYPVACLNSAILQLNSVIDKVFCSTLAVGAITFLNYGTKVINLFNGIFSTTVSVAVFPHIAELSAKDNKDSLNSFLHNYFSVLLCILVPFSLYLTYFSEDIISLLFGHGKFDSKSVLETSIILRTYAIGLIAMGFTT